MRHRAPAQNTAAHLPGGTDTGIRCHHTAGLCASVGRMDPRAGRRNFPVVLTDVSSRTGIPYGCPGAAFVDASGRQLGPALATGS
ncbi:hypothetical protein GCM10023086_51150 [Streptomyces venetus]|uniref:Uncharacterized protein n=1 Tax=Streptomyces venetus TaxID=1701086 RepID=A0ABP8GHQ2_9ACTN